MSNAGHFNSRYINRDKIDQKTGREFKTFEDYRTATIRHSDGSHGQYRGGKIVPGTFVPSKHVAKEDVKPESKYVTTPISTIVSEPEAAEKVNRVKKNFDVNAPTMKL